MNKLGDRKKGSVSMKITYITEPCDPTQNEVERAIFLRA
jgi:hypothetical protein